MVALKIDFNSNLGSLDKRTFKDYVDVAGKNFKLVNQGIEGNLYFLNKEVPKTFTIQGNSDDNKFVVTGNAVLRGYLS